MSKIEKGNEYANPTVESPSGSGHHRSGVVRFKGVDISRATAIELVTRLYARPPQY